MEEHDCCVVCDSINAASVSQCLATVLPYMHELYAAHVKYCFCSGKCLLG